MFVCVCASVCVCMHVRFDHFLQICMHVCTYAYIYIEIAMSDVTSIVHGRALRKCVKHTYTYTYTYTNKRIHVNGLTALELFRVHLHFHHRSGVP